GNEHVHGVEVEASIQPITGLTLNGTLGYDHYPGLLASSTTVTAPDINASLGAEYVTPKFAYDMYGLFRIDAVYNAEYTYEEPPPLVNPTLLAAARIPEQWVVDARLSLMDIPLGVAKGNVSFWVKNLLDLNNLQYVSNFGLYVPGTFM